MTGIFLALGLGILIGITLENHNIIESQQTQLIHQIENHYATLRSETQQMKLELNNLNNENVQLKELSSYMLTELINDRLTGINVGLISFSKHAPMNDLLNFMEIAGISVEAAITIFCDSYISNGTIINTMQQPHEMMNLIVEDLIDGMMNCNISPLIQEASELMMIPHVWRFDQPVDYIILIKQGISTFEYDNLLLTNTLKMNAPVVVVDTDVIDVNSLAKFKSLGISTVDSIETIYGKLALACVLSGNKGNFSNTSNALIKLPNPLFYQNTKLDTNNLNSANGAEIE